LVVGIQNFAAKTVDVAINDPNPHSHVPLMLIVIYQNRQTSEACQLPKLQKANLEIIPCASW